MFRDGRGIQKTPKKKKVLKRTVKSSPKLINSSSSFEKDKNKNVPELQSFPHPYASPRKGNNNINNAFRDTLSLFSPQKRIPKKVDKEAVVDAIYSALFSEKVSNISRNNNQFESGSDSEPPNENSVKDGLTLALFQKGGPMHHLNNSMKNNHDISCSIEKYISPSFLNTVCGGLIIL